MIRTRFAPSPTGLLHVGGLRTALYNYIFAKQNNGEFILRIEDTDQNRKVQDADSKIIKSLQFFGIEFDEGPGENEKYGPYFQSKRLTIYKKHYMQLIQDKKAYVCFENQGDLKPEYDIDKAIKKMESHKFVVKFFMKSNGNIEIYDELRGKIQFNLDLIDDPIIIKSDGFPTYHFANVIDDHYMKISHVIRGEEWISSLPKHVLLYKSFGWDLPKFVHLPLLLNPDKSKLSKRQGDVHVENFIEKGYLKDSIINFIALLGWHPSSDDELFNIEYLVNFFSLDRLQKSGAIFDITKLKWMNSYYIKKSNPKKLYKKMMDLDLINENFINKDQYYKVIQYAKNNSSTLVDLYNKTQLFFHEPCIMSKLLKSYDTELLFMLWIDRLKSLKKITPDNINNIIVLSKEKLNIYGKNLFIPLRLALIGAEHGPDLFTIINILGLNTSINRLEKIK